MSDPVDSSTTGGARSVARGAVAMASGTFVSRVLGMVRNIVLVAALGATGPIANAFDIANSLPNILFALLATGVLNAVLVPQIVRALRSSNSREYTDKLLTVSTTVMAAAGVIAVLAAPFFVDLYIVGANWTEPQRALAIAFAYWCMPQVFFYGLYTILGQVLNARSQFGPYMWAPVVNNVISIAGLGAFVLVFGSVAARPDALANWTSWMTAWVGGISTIGVATQALILIVPLARSGFGFSPRFGVRGIGLRSAGTVSAWIILATVVEQIGFWWVTRTAAAAPDAAAAAGFVGSVAGNAAYTQVLTIYILPHSLVTLSVATALFTGMAQAAQDHDRARVRTLLSTGLRVIGAFTVPASVLIAVLPVPVLRALVPSMQAADIAATAPALSAFAMALVPLGVMVMVKWVYFAFEDGKSVFTIQIPGTAVLIGGVWLTSQILPGQYWLAGAGLSLALSYWTIGLGRFWGIRRLLGGVDGFRIVRLYVRVLLAALVGAVPAVPITRLLGSTPAMSWPHAVGICLAAGLAMGAVYLVAARAMRVDEIHQLLAPVTGRFSRIRRPRHGR